MTGVGVGVVVGVVVATVIGVMFVVCFVSFEDDSVEVVGVFGACSDKFFFICLVSGA